MNKPFFLSLFIFALSFSSCLKEKSKRLYRFKSEMSIPYITKVGEELDLTQEPRKTVNLNDEEDVWNPFHYESHSLEAFFSYESYYTFASDPDEITLAKGISEVKLIGVIDSTGKRSVECFVTTNHGKFGSERSQSMEITYPYKQVQLRGEIVYTFSTLFEENSSGIRLGYHLKGEEDESENSHTNLSRSFPDAGGITFIN